MQQANVESGRFGTALVLSLAALAVTLFGERWGGLTSVPHLPHYRRVRSANERFELRSRLSYQTEDDGWRYATWQYAVFDIIAGEEIWQHRESSEGWLNAELAFAYRAAFLSDDAQLLITIGPRIGARGPHPRMAARIYRRDKVVVVVPFATICRYPRRLYPGEWRPWPYRHGLHVWSGATGRKWWSDARYDGRVLSIETTGISSCDLDVPALVERVSQGENVEEALTQVAERRLNIATLVRWLVYATIIVPAAAVVFSSAVRGTRRLLVRWRRNRASEGRCPHCGYPVYGLLEPRCPECGKVFDADLLVGAEPPLPTARRIPWAFVVALACGLALHVGVHELRVLLYRYLPTIGGVILERWGGVTVDAIYFPWWCSDFVLAWPPIIIAIIMYRLLHSRRG